MKKYIYTLLNIKARLYNNYKLSLGSKLFVRNFDLCSIHRTNSIIKSRLTKPLLIKHWIDPLLFENIDDSSIIDFINILKNEANIKCGIRYALFAKIKKDSFYLMVEAKPVKRFLLLIIILLIMLDLFFIILKMF